MDLSHANIQLVVSKEDLREIFLEFIEDYEEKARTLKEETGNKWLSQKETAELCRVSIGTLWRWDKTGYLKAHKIGRRVHYRLSEVNDFLNRTVP